MPQKLRIWWASLALGLLLTSGLTTSAETPAWQQHMLAGNEAYQQARFADAEQAWQTALVEAERLGPDDPRLFPPLDVLGRFYLSQGRYPQAEPLLRRALTIRETVLGPAHPDVAQSLYFVALALHYQARYADAESLLRRALEIREQALRSDHPDVANSLNNLATVLYYQGRYAEADPLHRRALAIREKALGPDHPDVAESLNNLGELYRAQRRYTDGEPFYRRALVILERALGPEHPNVAKSLTNLAIVVQSQSREAEAETLHRRALAVWERALGPEHLQVAQSLNFLALALHEQARYTEAEPLDRRALAIREKALGLEHLDVAQTLNNLAEAYRTQGKYAQAEPLHRRALAIREKTLGPEHPDVALSLNNLAMLYQVQRQYAEAEATLRRVLEIEERHLSPDSLRLAGTLNNLAAALHSQARYAESEPLLRRALAIREKALGPTHPAVAQSLNNLAELHRAQGKDAEAEPLHRRALAIREQALGPTHPDVANSLHNLARLLESRAHDAEAEPLHRRALMILEQVLGSHHPEVARSLEHLAALLRKTGREAESAELDGRAAAIRVGLTPETNLVVAALHALTSQHVDRPDPGALLSAAARGLRSLLMSTGLDWEWTAPAGRDEAVIIEATRTAIDRAVERARGQPERTALEHAAAAAMAASLGDSHTRFLPPTEFRAARDRLQGRPEYTGIGAIAVSREGRAYLWHLDPGGPGSRAGLRAFDRVLAVDGQRLEGVAGSAGRVRGPRGTAVSLTIQRRGEAGPRDVAVVREPITMTAVDHILLARDTGYIRFLQFSVGATTRMRDALKMLERQGMRALVLDLRHNSGGLWEELDGVADLFLPPGTTVYRRETREGGITRVSAGGPALSPAVPLGLLVNEATQSAAEALAAALQDAKRARLVGMPTPGHMRMGRDVALPGNAGISVSVGRIRRPAGSDLEGTGVTPDVRVELGADDLERGDDAQLRRALEIVDTDARARSWAPIESSSDR
jgi:C-terminal peptidase prc